MKQKIKKYAERIQIGTSLLIVVLASLDMFGKPARLVAILTLATGCIALGISIGMLAERKRLRRLHESNPDPDA